MFSNRMPTVRATRLDRILTLHLYRAPQERNQADDIESDLREISVESYVSRKNPATHDVWRLSLDLAQHRAELAALGTALLSVFTLWLKQRKGRRIEIQRPNLKIKAPSSSELRRVLEALHNYDSIDLMLNRKKRARLQVARKKANKRPRNSR